MIKEIYDNRGRVVAEQELKKGVYFEGDIFVSLNLSFVV